MRIVKHCFAPSFLQVGFRVVAGGEGFEPPTAGSGGLCPILTRLPAHNTLSRHEAEIINYGLWLRKEGYSIHTVRNDVKRLRRLDRRCSNLEPEAAKRLTAYALWTEQSRRNYASSRKGGILKSP